MGSAGLVAGPAAADYPPTAPSFSISGCSDVDRGVKVQFKDLQGGSRVTVAWEQISAAAFFSLARAADSGDESTTAKANGTASMTLPIDEAGDYALTASGKDSAGKAWTGVTEVTVLGSCDDELGGTEGSTGGGSASGESSTGGLTDTGANAGPLLAAGLGALAVGGTAVLVARRRRTTA
jgi:LPXTG-motif cell wall-anchored protein